MRDANAIRNLLLERLRLCLRSPGMCGGELVILNLMEYVTFIDERESDWQAEREKLNQIGAFRSTGVHGGFWAATRQTKRNDSQPASEKLRARLRADKQILEKSQMLPDPRKQKPSTKK